MSTTSRIRRTLVYDDVVQESSVLKGFPAFDVDRIEVLRGPQGSLFGRNTPAGVVKFQSAAPQKKFGGYVSLTEATYNTAAAEGAVNVPLGTDDAARISVPATTSRRFAIRTSMS